MKSLGFKDGREWVSLEAEVDEISGAGSLPTSQAIVDYGRGHGVDVRRFGESANDGWIWMQGPRVL